MYNDTVRPRRSFVRLLHAAVNVPAVDVYVNNRPVARGLKYKAYTDYLQLPPGSYVVEVYPTGEKQTPAIKQTLTVEPQTIYTVAALNDLEELKLFPIQDFDGLDLSEFYTFPYGMNQSAQMPGQGMGPVAPYGPEGFNFNDMNRERDDKDYILPYKEKKTKPKEMKTMPKKDDYESKPMNYKQDIMPGLESCDNDAYHQEHSQGMVPYQMKPESGYDLYKPYPPMKHNYNMMDDHMDYEKPSYMPHDNQHPNMMMPHQNMCPACGMNHQSYMPMPHMMNKDEYADMYDQYPQEMPFEMPMPHPNGIDMHQGYPQMPHMMEGQPGNGYPQQQPCNGPMCGFNQPNPKNPWPYKNAPICQQPQAMNGSWPMKEDPYMMNMNQDRRFRGGRR